jgi:hypothetical protein
MQTTTAEFSAPELGILPMPVEGAIEVLSDYIASQEYWLIVADGGGYPAVEAIMTAYYSDCGPESRFACLIQFKDALFGVFVLRRSLMTAEKYRWQLQKLGVVMSTRELVEGGALVRVASFNRAKARELTRTYLDLEPEGEEMAVRE